jgi:ABC-2 type transport system permease protein
MKKIKFSVKMNLLFACLIVLVIAIAFFFNAITLVLSNRYPLAVDLTANAAYGISDETKGFLAGLSQDVGLYVLADEGSFAGDSYLIQTKNILGLFPKYSRRIALRYVDYTNDPTFAAGYPDLTLTAGDILVTCGDKVRQIKLNNMFNYTYSASSANNLAVSSSRAEEALASAILFVTEGVQVRLAVLTGNGVQDMPVFTSLLSDNNYIMEQVSVATGTLDGYDGCLLIAPAYDLSGDALDKLDAFLYNSGEYGKTLFYCADVSQPALPNLDAFLAEWGVTVDDGAVFETTAAHSYSNQPYYPIAAYTDSKYSAMLKDTNTPFLMPLARPLGTLFDARDDRYTETLLSFYDTAGVRPSNADNTFRASQATRHGPFPAMVLASRKILDTTGFTKFRSNILVSASSGMLSSTSLQNSSVSNSEYLLAMFGDIFQREIRVSIQPRSLSASVLGVTTSQAASLGIILCGVIPGLILLAGIAVWLTRRFR